MKIASLKKMLTNYTKELPKMKFQSIKLYFHHLWVIQKNLRDLAIWERNRWSNFLSVDSNCLSVSLFMALQSVVPGKGLSSPYWCKTHLETTVETAAKPSPHLAPGGEGAANLASIQSFLAWLNSEAEIFKSIWNIHQNKLHPKS